MTKAGTPALRLSASKLVLAWALIALLIPGLRFVNWLAAPQTFAIVAPGDDIPDLEILFGDAPRYHAYAQAMLGRPFDSFYIRPIEGWRQTKGPPHRLVTSDRALTPWRDFSFEYPPGALAAILPPAMLTGDLVAYCLLFALEMSLFLTLALWLGVRAAERLRPGAGRTVLSFGIVYFLLTTSPVAWHYDALVALTLAGFAYGVAAGRPMWAALALAAAVLVKGAPVLLVPIALTHFALAAPWRRTALAAASGALVVAAGAGLYAWAAGAHALDMFAYHAGRPVQLESPYGAFALILNTLGGVPAQLDNSFASVNISAAYEPAMRALSGPLTVFAALAAIGWRMWRLGRDDDAATRAIRTLAASAAALIAFLAFGKVFSPQYIVWLFPLALVPAAALGGLAPRLLLGAVLVSKIEFPYIYANSLQALGFVVLARDALLLACAVALMAGASRLTLSLIHI